MNSQETMVKIEKSQFLSGLSTLKCNRDKPSIHVCANQDFTKFPFVCSDEDCECQINHENCQILMTKKIVKALRNKIISLEPVKNKIQKLFDKIIDKISDYKNQILDNFNQRLQKYFGLQEFEANLLKAIQSKQLDSITGKNIKQVFFNLKLQSLLAKSFSKKIKIIQKAFQKMNKRIDEFHIQLDLKVGDLNQRSPIRSLIINDYGQIEKIQQFFKKKKISQLRLLYRASQNSFSTEKFHKNCDGIINTLTICKTEYDKVIGGYTPLKWSIDNKYKEDHQNETFIFSLTNNHKFSPMNPMYQRTNISYVQVGIKIYNEQSHGPCFGNYKDLSIFNNAKNQYCISKMNCSFNNQNYKLNDPKSYQLFTGSSTENFKLKEWEVFEVIFDQ